MLLYFPKMHPDLLPERVREALPEAVRFLDPGLADAHSAVHAAPEAAPFDRRTAKALLTDTLRFGESVASPRDILAQGLAQQYGQAGLLSPESSGAVLGAVERSLSDAAGAAAPVADASLDARKQAQMLLLLAWNLEERLLDLRGIEAGLKSSWERLGESVAQGDAVVDDETDHEALALGRELSGMNPLEASAEALPWRKLLESFAVLTTGTLLCTAEAEIAAALAEAGVPEAALTLLPGAVRVFAAPAWRFLGLDRLPEARPWLAETLTLAVLAPGKA